VASPPKRLGELARLFLRLGATSFGGPAVHIAQTRDEVVTRRRWMTDDEYGDLIAISNLVPGPNSTEVAIHVGRVRAGWRGLLVAGAAFIFPAALVMLGLAWLYQSEGATPEFTGILAGIKPVLIAIVVHAVIQLAQPMLGGNHWTSQGAIAIGAVIASFAGVNELLILGTAGVVSVLWRAAEGGLGGRAAGFTAATPWLPFATEVATSAVALGPLFLFFLEVGSVLYGSGYVMLAFLREGLVVDRGWMSERQLLDAVAIGQVTPGPLFTTATFIGYVLAGVPGAVVATLGIFVPAFAFVALTNPIVRYLRGNPVFTAFLDGVLAASLALMISVAWYLGEDAFRDGWSVAIAIVAVVLLLFSRLRSVWLVLVGAVAGLLLYGVG
jgi:chromate transporter